MRQETITYDIYTFNELDGQAQKVAIEQVKEKYIDNDLYDFELPDQAQCMADELEKLGFEDCKVYYDCSYSQGSGATIDFSSFDPLASNWLDPLKMDHNELMTVILAAIGEKIDYWIIYEDWLGSGVLDSIVFENMPKECQDIINKAYDDYQAKQNQGVLAL